MPFCLPSSFLPFRTWVVKKIGLFFYKTNKNLTYVYFFSFLSSTIPFFFLSNPSNSNSVVLVFVPHDRHSKSRRPPPPTESTRLLFAFSPKIYCHYIITSNFNFCHDPCFSLTLFIFILFTSHHHSNQPTPTRRLRATRCFCKTG